MQATGPNRRGRGKGEANLELIRVAHEVAAERRPITLRGIAYQLFVRVTIQDRLRNSRLQA